MIDGILSDRFDLPFGVPQGSCLGPLLFSAYTSKLCQFIKNHVPNAHAYPDESQLYLLIKRDSSVGETEARGAMKRCIRAVRSWLIVDKLKLIKTSLSSCSLELAGNLAKLELTAFWLVTRK